MELMCKIGMFIGGAIILDKVTEPMIDKTIGKADVNSDLKKQFLVRGTVSLINAIVAVAFASVVTDMIFEEPEAVIETVSEFIQ